MMIVCIINNGLWYSANNEWSNKNDRLDRRDDLVMGNIIVSDVIDTILVVEV